MKPGALQLAATAAAALSLISCAVEGDFPSLAPRAAEREQSMEELVRPAPEVPSDLELRERANALMEQAIGGERAFAAAMGAAEAAVRAAGADGSESWIEAQQALSRLDAARSETMRALAELDQLAIARANAPISPADFAHLNAMFRLAEEMAADQQQRLSRLRAELTDR